MLTQEQITEVINKIITTLEKYDIPYKTYDNIDGTRHTLRFDDCHCIFPVDEDERETWHNPVKFRYQDTETIFIFEYNELDWFLDELKKYSDMG